MNSKKIIYIAVLIFILSMTGCSNNSERAENDAKYIPCISLDNNETYEVESPGQYLHANQTAEEAATDMKASGNCLDAWVNDSGNCVVRYNQELLEKQYNHTVERLDEWIEKSSVRVEVNYDCNEVKYYVTSTSEFSDLNTFTAIGPLCIHMQLLSGIQCENTMCYLKIIYEPTGEEMFNLTVNEKSAATNTNAQENDGFSGTELTEEEFEEKLNTMKK